MSFKPVIYLKDKCPFCLKVLIFLLEARLLDEVEVRKFVPATPDEDALKAELAPHFESVTFPSAQTAPGVYMKDSDALIGYFAERADVDPARLPVFQFYANGPFAQLGELFRENMELKKQLA